MGLKQILIAYENDLYGHAIANAFEARAEDNKISIVERIGFDRGATRTFAYNVKSTHGSKVDGVLLAGKLPEAADVIAALRKESISAPILGADGLDSTALLELADAGDVAVASVYHADLESEESSKFAKAYRNGHSAEPDTWAAQGYDALLWVANAMESAKTTSPKAVARALRAPDGWRGATGTIRFGSRGEVVARPVIFKRVRQAKFDLVKATAPVRAVKSTGGG
jgi:branched-chain amino acid transport system substrate-binding protein